MTNDLDKKEMWLDRKLERRSLLKKAAVGSALLGVMYVAPKFSSVGSKPAYASVSGVGTTGGDGGCTPGFWKTDTPSTQWPNAYAKTDQYDVIFVVPAEYADALGGKTLLTVLMQGGGCEYGLGRHSVAALLNAEFDRIAPSVADVIDDTNTALATEVCNDITSQKDIWDDLNNAGCLDGAALADD